MGRALRLKTPMATTFSSYRTYTKALESNAHKLKQQFPEMQLARLKDLLEELENDLEMASKIIQEETSISFTHV